MEKLYSWSWVEAQVAQTIVVWKDCAGRLWPGGPRYSPEEQRKREKAYDEGLRAVEREARKAPRTKAQRLEAQRRIVAAFPRFAALALGLEGETVQLLTDGFLPIGAQFARWARRFDASLSMADIIQACRNAWTACGLQPLLGKPLGITPSILGYSLLYPYSDNYLDDGNVSKAEKLQFSARFRDRLCGRRLAARNHREAAVWTMVQLIEEQYPRLRYPQVFECLLAIHRAQELSIAQLNSCGHCDDSEVLRISCAKGGTSVLADACLSHGWLSEEESGFSFEWGALLQLGDDLQDVREDLRRGSVTLFSRAAASGQPLDSLAIQLLNFSERVADRIDRLPNGPAMLKNLLRMSWRSLILMAVAGAQEFFTPAFLDELEPGSSFHFDFLRARNKRLAGRQGLYAVLFDAFLEAGEGGNDGLPLPAGRTESSLEAEDDLLTSPLSSRFAGFSASLSPIAGD
ncbi:MAG: hypothetical protein ACLP7O_08430 [Terracidiphilus sp.]